MTTKQMKFETSAHNELLDGVRQLADAVSVTMGPSGHNVVMDKSYGGPSVTRDGVSVAKEVDLHYLKPYHQVGQVENLVEIHLVTIHTKV